MTSAKKRIKKEINDSREEDYYCLRRGGNQSVITKVQRQIARGLCDRFLSTTCDAPREHQFTLYRQRNVKGENNYTSNLSLLSQAGNNSTNIIIPDPTNSPPPHYHRLKKKKGKRISGRKKLSFFDHCLGWLADRPSSRKSVYAT